MPRFFIDKNDISEDRVIITGDDVNHIRNVLRMKPGDEISLSDRLGTDYHGIITGFEDGTVTVAVKNSWPSYAELPVKLYLFQALVKGDKMDTVVQKAVELGAYKIVPFSCERAVVRLDAQKAAKKVKRWNAVAEAAAKQSGRALVPEVHDVVSFDEALQMAGELDKCIIPYEKAEGMESSRKAVYGIRECGSAGIFIGPEGGFDTSEVEKAVRAGAVPVTLGHRILRTETAGAAVMSVIMFASDRD
ncbi:MAG: 16S rRNA (uracil(1498)-N(3))-methyltransferase [Lachnospiraceae bacterium]|nr:16S rRNA (uracil(1498)-N(3))-methyltransferase [Lachnospiraceae bacterium]